MKHRYTSLVYVWLCFAVLTHSCGSPNSVFAPSISLQTAPIITKVLPKSGTAGDKINIYGFGFSNVPQYNIIYIGDHTTQAESYRLATNDEEGAEVLTFTIPPQVTTGAVQLYVIAVDNTSNTVDFELK